MTGPPPERWRLRDPVPALRRPDGDLQLGLEPPAGVLLGPLPSSAELVLAALVRPCTLRRLHRLAGPDADLWLPGLIDSLGAAGLLVRAAPNPGRLDLVIGTGPLTMLIIRLLLTGPRIAESAPRLRIVWPGAPTPPKELATLQRRHGFGFASHLDADPGPASGLAVVVSNAAEPDRAVLWRLAGRPHLIVCGSDLGARIGPLVLPGDTPCVRCEDLHRTQRDAAWPTLLAQLATPRDRPAGLAELHWAASTTAVQVGCWLADGLPDALGAALELPADGALRVRRYRAHPGCGCGAMG